MFTAVERLTVVTSGVVVVLFPLLTVQCVQCSRLSTRIHGIQERLTESTADSHALRKELQALRENSIIMSARASVAATAAVGISWTDTTGKISYSWKGTGFAVEGSHEFVTAAHVLQDAQNQVDSLLARGVAASIVCRLPLTEIATCLDIRYHPRYHDSHQSRNRPAIDVAMFSVASDAPVDRLPISARNSQIGEQIVISGFPTVIDQIRYDIFDATGFAPTVRIGRIERFARLSDLAAAPPEDLIQCNVPLVGGFSGAPVLNLKGEVVGIAVFSVHRLLRAAELHEPGGIPDISHTTRILDASHVSFAVSSVFILDLISNKESTYSDKVAPL